MHRSHGDRYQGTRLGSTHRSDQNRPRSSPRRDHRSQPDDRRQAHHVRCHRRHRRHRLGDHRLRPRRNRQRDLVRDRCSVYLRHRVPLLRAADRDEDREATRRSGHPGRSPRQLAGLHADRSPRALRSSLRRDRRRRPTGRSGTRRADGIPAGNDLDHHRRRIRRMRPGLPGVDDLDPSSRTQPRADGARRTRRCRRIRRPHRGVRHHDHPHRRPRPRRRQRTGRKPLGRLLARDDHPDCPVHGCVPAIPAPRTRLRGVDHRFRAADARHRHGPLRRRIQLGFRLVQPVPRLPELGDHHLRLRRRGAPRVAAPRPPRLPLDLHEGRHHRASRPGHRDRSARHAGSRGQRVRPQRPRSRLRRCAVPVPVHHHRLRRALRIPRTDRLRHHPEADGEGEPGPHHRLRRHAHRVVRRDHGPHHRVHPRTSTCTSR